MKILVCVSKTPDTTTRIAFNAAGTELDANGVQYIMNPYDEWYALVRGLELKEALGGTVTLINVGLDANDAVIRKGLAIGADNAIRINLEAQSALQVAQQIAHHAQQEQYDLILTGKETIDHNRGEVGAMLAELLDLPYVAFVSNLEVAGQELTLTRDIEGGAEVVVTQLPAVISAAKGLAEQRIPNMKGIMTAKSKPLTVLEPIAVPVLVSVVQYTLPPAKSAVKMIDAENMEELVRLLHEEAKVI